MSIFFNYIFSIGVLHHTHSTNNIELAVGYGIPALVLIRNPIDAIASLCVYDRNQNVDDAILRWIRFYRWIEQRLDKVVLADFELVTRNFNRIISLINDRFNTDFNPLEDLRAAEEEVVQQIRERDSWKGVEGTGMRKIPIPNPEREKLKEGILPAVLQHASISTAQNLYTSLIEW